MPDCKECPNRKKSDDEKRRGMCTREKEEDVEIRKKSHRQDTLNFMLAITPPSSRDVTI